MPTVFRSAIAFGLFAFLVRSNPAQAASPQMEAVFPFGCQCGTSVEVVLAGNDELKAATSLLFVHEGLRAERLDGGRFRITAAPDVPPRDYDFWAVTPDGFSNARRFVVSDIPEFIEQDGNGRPESAQELSVPGAVSGKIDHGPETDWYAFHADAGTAVTIACRSRSLDGSVEPALVVLGPDGRELRHATGHRPEPFLHLMAPETGTYLVRVMDRAYQNDPASVYRLVVTSGPYLIGAFPHVLAKGRSQRVTLYGFRLPGGQPLASETWKGLQTLNVEVDAPTEGDPDGGGWLLSPAALLDGFRYRHPQIQGDVRFGLSDDVVVTESGKANEFIAAAADIPVPCRVAGQFAKRGDVDWYRFAAKKGESLVVEAFGERLGRRMDLDVSIHDSKGKRLTVLKDVATPKGFPAAFPLASMDAQGTWNAPADGDYHLVVRDLYGGSVFGPDRTYEVTVGPARPAFRVVILPDEKEAGCSVPIPRGGVGVLKLVAIRGDGFKHPIHIRAENLPEGVTASDCKIDSQDREASLSLSASAEAVPGVWTAKFVAEVEFDGRSITAPFRGTTFLRDGQPAVRFTEGIPLAILTQGSDEK